MANIPAQLYRGDSDYLGTISNVDGQILFDSDKKEIFVDDGTTRESYGGGAGDKTYATLAQAQADIANISEKDTVFVKEGTSGSLTQRVDDLEDEVEQINTDLSDLMGWTPLVEPFQGGGSDITLPQGCNELYIDVFCGNIHHGISIPVALITDTAQFFMVAGGYMNGTYQNYIRIALSETRYEINAAFEGGQDWRVTALNTIYYR